MIAFSEVNFYASKQRPGNFCTLNIILGRKLTDWPLTGGDVLYISCPERFLLKFPLPGSMTDQLDSCKP